MQATYLRDPAALIELIPEAILVRDLEGRILLWNHGAEEFYGWSRAEACGRISHDLLQTEFPEEPAAILDHLSRNPVWEGEIVQKRRNGERVSVRSRWTIERDNRGAPVNLIEVNSGLARLEDALEAAHVGAWDWDLRTDQVIWNAEQARMLGYAGDTGTFTAADLDARMHPEDRDGFWKEVREAIERRRPYQREFRILLTDGTVRWLLTRGKVLQDVHGHACRMTGTLMEITERKTAEARLRQALRNAEAAATEKRKAEERLRRLSENLKRSNDELRQFAYIASHDLKEPLRNIAIYLQLLERTQGGKLNPQGRNYIQESVNCVGRMHGLIDGVMRFSRLGSGGLHPERLRAADLVRSALANLGKIVRESGARIDVEDLPVIQGDRDQLTQLFQNLISNAVKFRGPGVPPVVRIGAERRSRFWEFRVSDNGIGIPRSSLDKIFQIFRRLHRREEFPGEGIGLALCKKVVDSHGGEIWVESEEGKGSTFRFTLSAPS